MKEQRGFSDWKEVNLESSLREENVEGKLINDLDASLENWSLSFSFLQDHRFLCVWSWLSLFGIDLINGTKSQNPDPEKPC